MPDANARDMLREAAAMGRLYGKTPSEMLLRPVALWRVDEAATQMLFAEADADHVEGKTAKQVFW